jgi:hypothetical protein
MTQRLLDILLLAVLIGVVAAPESVRAQSAIENLVAGQDLLMPQPPLPINVLIVPPRFSPPLNLPLRYPTPPTRPITGLKQIVQAASIIFSGHVTFVGRSGPASGQAPAATIVTFQVEQAIRGTTTGQNLTIHEWAGLWNRGERYRVGEHVLLFLYPPSKFGLTSPVSGPLGRFALDPLGKVVIGNQHEVVFAADPVLGGRTAIPSPEFIHAIERVGSEE